MTRCKYQKIRRGSVLSLLLSRIVPLLLKIAYNGFPLKYSSKDGWNYVNAKGEMGKMRTASGQKTGQILGPRHAKVLLSSGKMTSDDNNPDD